MGSILRLAMVLHVALYRLLGGRLVGRMGRAPILLVNATGRRSGTRRTTPLLYQRDGADYIVIASAGGQPRHPAWWLNLKANPSATIEVGREHISVQARAATAEEKPRLWQVMTAVYPSYDAYQRKTTREIDVVVLTPTSSR